MGNIPDKLVAAVAKSFARSAQRAQSTSPGKRIAGRLLGTIVLVIAALGIAYAQHKGWIAKGSGGSGGSGTQTSQTTGQTNGPSTASTSTAPARVPGRDAQGSIRTDTPGRTASGASTASLGDGGIPELFRRQQSDTWVEATGTIVKLLPDDNETRDGSDRHQKFLVRITRDLTILISHNIDTTQRVPAEEGDTINFRGEYEWSDKGGTVHFTHAPKFKRRDPGGWIEHEGVRYE